MTQLVFDVHERLNFLTVSRDRLTITYNSHGVHSHDIGAIRATEPFRTDAFVNYFEIEVLNVGTRNTISIGLCDASFTLNRFPGCERGSFGFHGDDGRCYLNGNRGEAYGTTFRNGDVIGCALIVEHGELFFTRNGEALPIVSRGVISGPMYAVVGLHSLGESIRANFGQTPFVFNIAETIENERRSQAARVAGIALNSNVVLQLIRRHLLYNGFATTLAALDKTHASGFVTSSSTPAAATATSAAAASTVQLTNSSSHQPAAAAATTQTKSPVVANLEASIQTRAALREAMRVGDVEQTVLSLLATHWPAFFARADCNSLLMRLRCQAVVERIRNGDSIGALALARTTLSPWRTVDEVRDTLALLAYSMPMMTTRDSPLASLLDVAHRLTLADHLNACVVAIDCGEVDSPLALISRHQSTLEVVRRRPNS